MMRRPSNKSLIIGVLGLTVAGVGVLSSQIDHSREPSSCNLFGSGYYSYASGPNGTLMPEEMIEPGHTLSAAQIAKDVAELDELHEEQRQQHSEFFVEDLPGSVAKDDG